MTTKPDNLVALHHHMTGSYVVDAPKLEQQPLDKWAVRLILSQKERIEELEAMVKVFRGCIETGLTPELMSPCYQKVISLVGLNADDQKERDGE